MFIDDVSDFKNLCKERVCFYSKNHPYIKINALEAFAKSIVAKEIVYDNADHFNKNAGYSTFEDIIKYL